MLQMLKAELKEGVSNKVFVRQDWEREEDPRYGQGPGSLVRSSGSF